MMRVLLAVVLLGFSSVSFGAFMSGHELLAHMENCEKYHAGQETKENYRSCGVGKSYVAGVFDTGHSLAERWLFKNHVCKPDGVGRKQAADIVKKYMGDHPEQLDYAAAGIVFDALSQAYPCD
jgi:hypothetical protein